MAPPHNTDRAARAGFRDRQRNNSAEEQWKPTQSATQDQVGPWEEGDRGDNVAEGQERLEALGRGGQRSYTPEQSQGDAGGTGQVTPTVRECPLKVGGR